MSFDGARVQLLSDLHLEHFRGKAQAFLDTLDPSDVDILVLAGDITTRDEMFDHLMWFCRHYPQVVYVPGNHEYYSSWPGEIDPALTRLAEILPNFHLLNNKKLVVDGVTFVGGTLWFPKPPPAILRIGKGQDPTQRFMLADFRLIQGFEPWVYEQHAACVKVLTEHAHEAQVVVTHHMPASLCTAERFRGSPLDHFFCHDMTDLILKAKPPLWMYGHSHDRQKHTLGETTLVCNPLGYPNERDNLGEWNPKLMYHINRFHVPHPGDADE